MKKVFSHVLPVDRVIYADGTINKDVTIIHLTKDIYQEDVGKNPNTYWHTPCGKNIQWQRSPRLHEITNAIEGKYGYKVCPHCFANAEELLSAYNTEIEFDRLRRIAEDKQREQEHTDRMARWDKMMTVLDEEACDVLDGRKWYTDFKRESIKYYTVQRNGVYYKVKLTIEEYDPSKEEN